MRSSSVISIVRLLRRVVVAVCRFKDRGTYVKQYFLLYDTARSIQQKTPLRLFVSAWKYEGYRYHPTFLRNKKIFRFLLAGVEIYGRIWRLFWLSEIAPSFRRSSYYDVV